MTLDEAQIIVNYILVEADGGCASCVNNLLNIFEDLFPFTVERRESYYGVLNDKGIPINPLNILPAKWGEK